MTMLPAGVAPDRRRGQWWAPALALLAVGVSACASATGANYPYADEPDPRKLEYVIGVTDELDIGIWKHPELGARARVRPDGTVTLALLGDIRAVGLTPSELREEVKRRLSSFIVSEEAIVTISVVGANSYYFTVSGNVGRQGRFQAGSYVTVAEAMALAGGPNRFASADESFILRTERDGTRRRIPIDYEQILRGERLEQNIVIMRGDHLIVP